MGRDGFIVLTGGTREKKEKTLLFLCAMDPSFFLLILSLPHFGTNKCIFIMPNIESKRRKTKIESILLNYKYFDTFDFFMKKSILQTIDNPNECESLQEKP